MVRCLTTHRLPWPTPWYYIYQLALGYAELPRPPSSIGHPWPHAVHPCIPFHRSSFLFPDNNMLCVDRSSPCPVYTLLPAMATRAYDGRDSIAAVQERVLHTGAKTDKTRALRQNCQAALGSRFPPIYDYLSRVRSQNPAPDEKEVRRCIWGRTRSNLLCQACPAVASSLGTYGRVGCVGPAEALCRRPCAEGSKAARHVHRLPDLDLTHIFCPQHPLVSPTGISDNFAFMVPMLDLNTTSRFWPAVARDSHVLT